MKQKAFTLLELLVVITIIGILSSIVIVSMSGSTDSAIIAKSKAYAQQVHALLGANAVGVWNFDEGTGTTVKDISGYGNNGILQGNAHFVDSEIEGYALSFDGSGDYINCGNNNILNITESITIEAWVKINVYRAWAGIITKGIDTEQYTLLMDRYDGNKLQFDGNYASGQIVIGTSILSTDIWYHAVAIYSNRNVKIYLNGLLDKNQNVAWDLSSGNENMTIGVNPPGTDEYFNGLIDEVRIYSAALPVTEIRKHYVQGLEKLLTNQVITKAEYGQRMEEFNQYLISI